MTVITIIARSATFPSLPRSPDPAVRGNRIVLLLGSYQPMGSTFQIAIRLRTSLRRIDYGTLTGTCG